MITYIPQNILTTENLPTKGVVTSEHWNEILNLLVSQGNNSATAIYNLIAALGASTGAADIGTAPITGVVGTNMQLIMSSLKGLIDLCYTASATDSLLSQKETVANANQLVKSIEFNSSNGTFIITTQGNTVTTIDTALEKVAVNFAYDSVSQSLVLTLADGSTTTVPLSAFITETEFLDSATVDFSVVDHTVTATIKNASITEAMLTSATIAALIGYKNSAETAATNAAASEANALVYKNAAGVSASEALTSKNAAKTSETNSKTSETNSKTSETNAKTSETNAATSASEALQYRNEASSIVGDKVISFNGRKDTVVPASGDYTAEQVGAIPATEKGAVSGVASLDATGKVPTGQLPTVAPAAHKSSHATGGSDVLSPADIGAATSTHTHGNITNDGKIGSTADLMVVTGTGGAVTTKTVADTLTALGLSDAALRKTTKPLSEIAVGSEFYLYENSTLTPFIKLKTDYEGSGRTLVIRKNPITAMAWNSVGTNAYSGSTLDAYLNSTYIGYLDAITQAQLANVNIPYTIGNGNNTISTLARKCFALSATELGFTVLNVEGSAVSYFSSNATRAAPIEYWARTPTTSTTTDVRVVTASGGMTTQDVTWNGYYVRPALTLPETLEAPLGYNTLSDMSGNEFVLPYAKIATGSYTGTGTYGESNPNSYVFTDVEPKFMVVGASGYFGVIPCCALTTSYTSIGCMCIVTNVGGTSNAWYGLSCKKSTDGKTIYWYNVGTSEKQLNTSSESYSVMGI